MKFQFSRNTSVHCRVSFLFLHKRCQINGFLAEISNRKWTKKFPRKLHLSSPPHRWHCVCKIGQRSHWSHWVCTITSLYEDVILWYWPLLQQMEIPCVQLPAQPLKCSDLKTRWLCYANHHSHCLQEQSQESRKVKDKKVPLNLLPWVFFTTYSMRKDYLYRNCNFFMQFLVWVAQFTDGPSMHCCRALLEKVPKMVIKMPKRAFVFEFLTDLNVLLGY